MTRYRALYCATKKCLKLKREKVYNIIVKIGKRIVKLVKIGQKNHKLPKLKIEIVKLNVAVPESRMSPKAFKSVIIHSSVDEDSLNCSAVS